MAGTGITQHVAFRALMRSVLINMVATTVVYELSVPHFPANSLLPLAISGLPPILWLAYSIIKLWAVDFLGLFAVENVIVNMVALVLSHTEMQALIGRSMQNVVLAAIFLASLAFRKPLVLFMARQFATGNDPDLKSSFDAAAMQPDALRTYRALTWLWVAGLLIKAAGNFLLATQSTTRDYLIFSPLWDLASDSVLVTASILYGRMKLAGAGRPGDLREVAKASPG